MALKEFLQSASQESVKKASKQARRQALRGHSVGAMPRRGLFKDTIYSIQTFLQLITKKIKAETEFKLKFIK